MTRQDFINRAVTQVVDDYGCVRKTSFNSIVFSNGWVASIVKNTKYSEKKEYSVAVTIMDTLTGHY